MISKPNYVIKSTTISGDCNSLEIAPDEFDLSRWQKTKKFIDFTDFCQNELPPSDVIAEGPSCYWGGGVFHYSGHSTMNRNMLRNLNSMGMNVKLYTWLDSMDIPLDEVKWFAQTFHRDIPLHSPIVWGKVASGPFVGPVVHYTMSENEGKLNKYLLDTLENDEEIWVPSQWNKEIFLESGVKTPIFVMPLGVDPDLFDRTEEKAVFTSGVKGFTFVSVSAWSWRKGFDVLLKAFFNAFSGDDDVSLVIITGNGEPDVEAKTELNEILSSFRSSNAPHVVFCESSIPEKVMPAVYSSSDAFALFPRGEGWCLPYCEAAACGLPIVGSLHGGQSEFLTEDDFFFVVPDKLTPVRKSMLSISEVYDGTCFADYSDAVIKEAGDVMRFVYENREEAKNKAAIYRERLVSDFSWRVSAKRVYNRLVELQP